MKTTSADIVKKVEQNHIWLNAFKCINPTDEFLRDLGKAVLDKLNHKDCLLPMYLDDDPPGTSRTEDLAEYTPVLYLSVNKS